MASAADSGACVGCVVSLPGARVSLPVCCSVAQSCPTLCDLVDCGTPGRPDLHSPPEFAQIHVRRVGDAIQPSHPLSSPSLLPSIFPSIRVFSSESVLHNRRPKDWSFSFSISPSSEYSGLISFKMDWLDLLAVQGFSGAFSNTTVQKHQFFSDQPPLWSNTWLDLFLGILFFLIQL